MSWIAASVGGSPTIILRVGSMVESMVAKNGPRRTFGVATNETSEIYGV